MAAFVRDRDSSAGNPMQLINTRYGEDRRYFSIGPRFRSEVHCLNCADGNKARRCSTIYRYVRLAPSLAQVSQGRHLWQLFTQQSRHSHRVFSTRMIHNERHFTSIVRYQIENLPHPFHRDVLPFDGYFLLVQRAESGDNRL